MSLVSYVPTAEDWLVVNQRNYIVKHKLTILDNNFEVVKEIEGIVSGVSVSESADSDVRRTTSFILTPTWQSSQSTNEKDLIWLNKFLKLQVGILNLYTDEYKWYNQGIYVFTDTSSTYDEVTNQLTVNCGDLWTMLDGSKNGIIGAFTATIPAYEELLLYSWYKSAKTYDENNAEIDDSKKTDAQKLKYSDNYTDFFNNWCLGIEEGHTEPRHKNILTEKMSNTVKSAAFQIISNYDLTDTQLASYIKTISDAIKAYTTASADYKYRDFVVYYSEDRGYDMRDVLMANEITDVIIDTLTDFSFVKKYVVEEFGEYKGTEDNNPDGYLEYRQEHDDWNSIPYDLEQSAGSTVASMLTTLRDIYPNHEMYFDEDTFVAQMIPSCTFNPVVIDNDRLQEVLISEQVATPLNAVRNMCEVLGAELETDWYKQDDDVQYSNNTYILTEETFGPKYYTGDKIAVKIPTTNADSPKIQMRSKELNENDEPVGDWIDLDACIIYDPATGEPLKAGRLKAGRTYVFNYKCTRENSVNVNRFFLMGQYMVHAMDVLIDSTFPFTTVDGTVVNTKQEFREYLRERYAYCDIIHFTEIDDSPFTVQKIGEILDVKTGNEYENITNDADALERAKYDNWVNCRLTDTVTLVTKALPFVHVNTKVAYKKQGEDEIKEYIVKQVATDYSAFTSSLTLMTFYPLYENNGDTSYDAEYEETFQ